MELNTQKIKSIAIAAGTFLVPFVAFAQIQNPIRFNSLEELITNIVNQVLTLAAIIAVAFIVYAGFLYITAQGDTKQIDKAKTALFGAVIGLVVIGLAYSIVAFVIGAVGGGEGGGANGGPRGVL